MELLLTNSTVPPYHRFMITYTSFILRGYTILLHQRCNVLLRFMAARMLKILGLCKDGFIRLWRLSWAHSCTENGYLGIYSWLGRFDMPTHRAWLKGLTFVTSVAG